MSDAIAGAAAEIRRQLKDKVDAVRARPEMAEVLRLHQALNTLETLAAPEAPATSLAEIFGLDANQVSFRDDEFYGVTHLEAAKRYLKKHQKARPFDEIVNAIESHGGGSVDRDQLRTSLTRSTYDIAKVGHDLYGLVEFYGIKRGRKKKAVGAPPETESDMSPENRAFLEEGGDGGEDDTPEEAV